MRRLVPIALLLVLFAPAAGAAPATASPRLVVSSGDGTVRIALLGAGAAGAVTIHMPATDAIAAAAPGTVLGDATATDPGGTLAGRLVAAAPGSGGCGAVPVQARILQLAGGGRTLDVPVYGPQTLVVCLPATPLQAVGFTATAIEAAHGERRWTSDFRVFSRIAPGGARLSTRLVVRAFTR